MLTGQDAWNARYLLNGRYKIFRHYTEEVHREHLVNMNVRSAFPDISDKDWNDLMYLLSMAAEGQPFGEPYLWHTHQKKSFARWLRSWRV